MEQKNYYEYYVAVVIDEELFSPTIVEKFHCKEDADSYAALMHRVKRQRYIVLERLITYGLTA